MKPLDRLAHRVTFRSGMPTILSQELRAAFKPLRWAGSVPPPLLILRLGERTCPEYIRYCLERSALFSLRPAHVPKRLRPRQLVSETHLLQQARQGRPLCAWEQPQLFAARVLQIVTVVECHTVNSFAESVMRTLYFCFCALGLAVCASPSTLAHVQVATNTRDARATYNEGMRE
jgi:hypothetical protein